jgi:hypothetical protein
MDGERLLQGLQDVREAGIYRNVSGGGIGSDTLPG